MNKAIFAVLLGACSPFDEGGRTASDPVAPVPGPTDPCNALGLPKVALQAGTGEARLDIAGDFTVRTQDGPWTFSEAFTGCETYLFLPSVQSQVGRVIWDDDGLEFRERLPANTHVFFVSTDSDRAEIDADLAVVQDAVEEGLKKLPEAEEDAVRRRLHYVTTGLPDLQDEWVGRLLVSPGYGFGIDRAQRIRDIGMLGAAPSFSDDFSQNAWEAVHYNWEAERDAKSAADGATVVPSFVGAVVEDSGWAGIRTYADVRLPSAEEMGAFDTLTLDLSMECVGPGEVGTCPEWDRIVEVWLCQVDDPDVCDIEIGRWISAYSREGRWLSDASYLLPLLADGGTRRLAAYSIDPYELTLDFRLSTQGVPKPAATEVVWRGFPGMDDNYLANFPSREVWIPANATHTELSVVVTGHGMSPGLNCAEFCDTKHIFTVNGVTQTISFPQTGELEDCQDQTFSGTIPNQYGTWWYGRANWCPGKVVAPLVLDFTDAVTPGSFADVSYTAEGPQGPMPGGGATIDLSVFLTSRR